VILDQTAGVLERTIVLKDAFLFAGDVYSTPGASWRRLHGDETGGALEATQWERFFSPITRWAAAISPLFEHLDLGGEARRRQFFFPRIQERSPQGVGGPSGRVRC
jgi:hypothetical protein